MPEGATLIGRAAVPVVCKELARLARIREGTHREARDEPAGGFLQDNGEIVSYT